MNAEQAKIYVAAQNIPINVDYFTLTQEQVSEMLKLADMAKYKRPKGSKLSRGRSFYKELMKHFKE